MIVVEKLDSAKNHSQRLSSIELLRMISMVMIMFHHFAMHGLFVFDPSSPILAKLWYYFMLMGGKIGSNIFVLISGYFLISEKESNSIEKILKLWGQIFFYSMAIYLVFVLFGVIPFTINGLAMAFLPITSEIWWFASTYFILYLLHPFINKFLHSLNQKNYQNLLLLLTICWSLLPTLTGWFYESNYLLWFITLYCIAGYLKIYGVPYLSTSKRYFQLFFILGLFFYAYNMVLKFYFPSIHSVNFYEQQNIFILFLSLMLFLAFLTLKMKYHSWINMLSTTTFGIYLIHDHSIVRNFLWVDIFQNNAYQNSNFLIPYSIMVVTVVYIFCLIIDLLRSQTMERIYMKVIHKHIMSWTSRWKQWGCTLRKIVFNQTNE